MESIELQPPVLLKSCCAVIAIMTLVGCPDTRRIVVSDTFHDFGTEETEWPFSFWVEPSVGDLSIEIQLHKRWMGMRIQHLTHTISRQYPADAFAQISRDNTGLFIRGLRLDPVPYNADIIRFFLNDELTSEIVVVANPVVQYEMFGTGGFDLINTTLAFVPDHSLNYYRTFQFPRTEFLSEPQDENAILLDFDRSGVGSDSGGQGFDFGDAMQLFGLRYSTAEVLSDGQISFENISTDSDDILGMTHGLISGIGDDQASVYRELDRFVITYQDDKGEFSSQVRLFDSGVVDMTFLRMEESSVGANIGIMLNSIPSTREFDFSDVEVRDIAAFLDALDAKGLDHEMDESNVYVDSSDGSDMGDGTAGNPWRTIGHAMNQVAEAATFFQPVTIRLAPGDYEEQVTFEKNVSIVGSGLVPELTTIQHFENNSTIVTLANNTGLKNVRLTTPDPENSLVTLAEARDSTFVIENVVFDGRDNQFSTGLFIVGDGGIDSSIRGSLFVDLASGIRAIDTSPAIGFNTFEDIQSVSIFIRDDGASVPNMGEYDAVGTGLNSFIGTGEKYIDNNSSTTAKARLNYFELDGVQGANETQLRDSGRVSDRVELFPVLPQKINIAGAVVGVVLDKRTLTPIPLTANPTVTILGAPTGVRADGLYFFLNAPINSNVPMVASAEGYEVVNAWPSIPSAGSITREDFFLNAISGEGEGDSGLDGEGEPIQEGENEGSPLNIGCQNSDSALAISHKYPIGDWILICFIGVILVWRVHPAHLKSMYSTIYGNQHSD